jgi:hypothetical protein
MPTRRISPAPKRWEDPLERQKTCQHPEHNPPSMRVFEPGIYEHTCPACKSVLQFTVRERPSLSAPRKHHA